MSTSFDQHSIYLAPSPRSIVIVIALATLLAWPAAAGGILSRNAATEGSVYLSALSQGSFPNQVPVVTLVQGVNATVVPASFWGTTLPVSSAIQANLSEFLSATPSRYIVWPGGGFGDEYDPLAGVMHHGNGYTSVPGSNEGQFVALCRAIGCHAIFEVPGEINSTSYAAAEVRYTEQTLGFQPDYWEIGNEPARWKHYNTPWSAWVWTQHSSVTPIAYADEVRNYTLAMRTVDPSLRIVGFPGDGRGVDNESSWLSTIAGQDGSLINAMAIHVYPAGLGPKSNATLQGFLSTLTGRNSLPTRVPVDRAAMALACPSCPTIPLFATELGSAVLNGTDTPFVEGFPQAIYVAAEAIQAMDLNLTNIDYFSALFDNAGSWMNLSMVPKPAYESYSEILSRLGTVAYPVTVSGNIGGLYSIVTERGGRHNTTDLLFVNANTTFPAQFSPKDITGLSGVPTETWSWNDSSQEPVTTYWPDGVPSNWTVPPVSLALFEASRNSSIVTYHESGLATSLRWFLTVGTTTETTVSNAMTFFLPEGRYNVTTEPPLSAPGGGRIVGFTAPILTVGPAPISTTITFVTQYHATIRLVPGGGGFVSASSGWYNASANLSLRATARSGFRFIAWYGWGAGSYSGRNNPANVTVYGSIGETAVFAELYAVTFVESGLPLSTVWGVDIRNVTMNTTSPSLTFSLTNGTYAYSVLPVPGYRILRDSGVFNVAGGTLTIPLQWAVVPIRQYPIHFNASGLDSDAAWVLAIGTWNATVHGAQWTVYEPNGSYSYLVTPPVGYLIASPNGTFLVNGLPLNISLQFNATQPVIQPGAPPLLGEISRSFLPAWVELVLVAALVVVVLAVNLSRRRISAGAARASAAPATPPGPAFPPAAAVRVPTPAPRPRPVVGAATETQVLIRRTRLIGQALQKLAATGRPQPAELLLLKGAVALLKEGHVEDARKLVDSVQRRLEVKSQQNRSKRS